MSQISEKYPLWPPPEAEGYTLSELSMSAQQVLGTGGRLRPIYADAPLPVGLLARWLYREALTGSWFSFTHLPSTCPINALDVCSPGWIYMEGPLKKQNIELMIVECQKRQLQLWWDSDDTPIRLKTEVIERLLALDQLHATATDPDLKVTRQRLASACELGQTVILQGPPSSGRHSLALWAHILLKAPKPFARLSTQHSDTIDRSRWILVDGAEDLNPHHWISLTQRIQPLRPIFRDLSLAAVGNRPRDHRFSDIIGTSQAICKVLQQVQTSVQNGLPILLQGETGTGKSSLARVIHRLYNTHTFVEDVIIQASDNLQRSQLFGHERGAFTGADNLHIGLLERASGGTLFLDEIDSLSFETQTHLLKPIEEQTIYRIGGKKPIPINIKIITASNKDIHHLVTQGLFREDLYYRMCKDIIHLPPLRHRGDDVILLAEAHLRQRYQQRPFSLHPTIKDYLRQAAWEGNIRELQTFLTQATSHFPPIVSIAPHPTMHQFPVLIISSESSQSWPVSESMRTYFSNTIEILPLQHSSLMRLKHAIHTQLAGYALLPDACNLLLRFPWKGGFIELKNTLHLLKNEKDAARSKIIQSDTIKQALPSVWEQLNQPTILLRGTLPVVTDPSGIVFSTDTLVIGRSMNYNELQYNHFNDQDLRKQHAWSLIQKHKGFCLPEILSLSHLSYLSRAQLMIVWKKHFDKPFLELTNLSTNEITIHYTKAGTKKLILLQHEAACNVGSATTIHIKNPDNSILKLSFHATFPGIIPSEITDSPVFPVSKLNKHLNHIDHDEAHALVSLLITCDAEHWTSSLRQALPTHAEQLGSLFERLRRVKRIDQRILDWFKTHVELREALAQALDIHPYPEEALKRLPSELQVLMNGS